VFWIVTGASLLCLIGALLLGQKRVEKKFEG